MLRELERSLGKGDGGGSIPPGSTSGPWLTIARFWARVAIPKTLLKHNVCWNWTGSLVRGYGQFKPALGRPPVTAHRFAWEFAHGPIPEGKFILHSCNNPRCCNPYHLRPGTHAENMQDKIAAGTVWRGGPRKKDAAQ